MKERVLGTGSIAVAESDPECLGSRTSHKSVVWEVESGEGETGVAEPVVSDVVGWSGACTIAERV